jgi:hypothetical protein
MISPQSTGIPIVEQEITKCLASGVVCLAMMRLTSLIKG